MLHQRFYTFITKAVRKDGTTVFHKHRQAKWIKTQRPQRKYRPRGEAKVLWSKRFGYLDVYTAKQVKEELICPSGYTFGQGMNKLSRLWCAYMARKKANDIEKMERYARAIQETQEDMGLKTSSFPHLGIFGDTLVFYDQKTHEPITQIEHTHLKDIQDMEKAKEKLKEIAPLLLVEPDLEKGEELVTIADEIPQPKREPRYRVKHGNRMHYTKKRDEEWTCEKCDEIVPPGKNHICNLKEEEGSNVITMTDDIPFM